MIANLALILPLLAGVNAIGGSHYVANRIKDIQHKREAEPAPEPEAEADPLGGSHYVAAAYRKVPPQARKVSVEYVLDERGNMMFDERGLPITTTTTVVVPMTSTNLVWVTATEDAPWVEATPTASGSDGLVPSSTASNPAGPSSTAPGPSSVQPPSSAATPTSSSSSTYIWWTPPTTPWWTPETTVWWTPETTPWWTPETTPWWTPDPTGSPTQSPSAPPTVTPSPVVSSQAPSSAITSATEVPPSSAVTSATEVPPSSAVTSATEVSTSSTVTSASQAPPSSSATEVPPSSSAAPTSTTTSTSTPQPTGNSGMIMNGYYADWTASQLPPENVDWSVYDVMNYAFAEPNADGTLTFSAWNSADILTRLVSSAHGAGKRVVVSVGGWTGSAYFSSIVASSSLRSTFLQSLLDMVDTYKLDGVDLDWEYPGAMGAAGNQVSPQDAANYLVFLKELRAALPSPALITAATQVWPFYGPNGQSLPDVSEFAAIYDWILIMNYDIWGSSTTPGPNAPLSDGCKDSAQPTANAHAAIAAWSAAGMPANKITLGVPAYGYLQRSSANQLYGRRSWPAPPHKRQSLTLANSEGGTSSGQISWNSIIKQGALTLDSSGNYIGGRGFTRNWDECSSTPWLKSEASGQIVTYDDAQSLRLKGEFAKQAGLRGCSVWSLDGEYLNGRFPLSEATRGGMGI